MNSKDNESGQIISSILIELDYSKKPILCKYCKRTEENGIRCLGMCVADSDY